MSGSLTLGQLIVFIAYLAQLYAADQPDHPELGPDRRGTGRRDRVFEVLETESRPEERVRQFPPGA